MTKKMAVPITSGNQPPWASFSVVAAKKVVSIVKKKPVANMLRSNGYFHAKRSTKKVRKVSIIIVAVTANPYADARFEDEPNPSTAMTTTASRVQLTKGI